MTTRIAMVGEAAWAAADARFSEWYEKRLCLTPAILSLSAHRSGLAGKFSQRNDNTKNTNKRKWVSEFGLPSYLVVRSG